MHSSLPFIQFKAAQLLRNILEAHDIDSRIQSSSIAKTHVAYMYAPFLSLFTHFIPLMSKRDINERKFTRDEFTLSNLNINNNNNNNSESNFKESLNLEPLKLFEDRQFFDENRDLVEFDLEEAEHFINEDIDCLTSQNVNHKENVKKDDDKLDTGINQTTR